MTQYVMLSTANSNGKNTLENRSMFMARVRFLCARAVVAASAAAVACGGGRGGGGIEWPSFNFKLLLKLKLNDFLFNGFGGISESPSTMFTKQYSMRAINTNTVHADINVSTALRYETGGSAA